MERFVLNLTAHPIDFYQQMKVEGSLNQTISSFFSLFSIMKKFSKVEEGETDVVIEVHFIRRAIGFSLSLSIFIND